ncbi:hypothetical protein [Streptomyces vietnamensis]|uniref:hypothetical protein n=1 Tax=Streptomyces vietnamensis TaxID=362257 RepID=UPI00344AD0B9
MAAGERAPEALRRLIHALLGSQNATLSDDATIMVIEWRPSGGPPGHSFPPGLPRS